MQVIDEFVEVVYQEIEIIKKLAALGTEKQTSINDFEKIEMISRSEQELVNDLEKYEHQRVQLFDVIAPTMSLNEWLEQQDEPKLKELFVDLHQKNSELQEINKINQQLIHESLAFIQFNLNLFVDDAPQTYNKPGTQNVTRSIFDRKV